MTSIKKKPGGIFLLKIKAKPNSRAQKILKNGSDEFLQVNLTSKPIKNRANRELLKMLRKKLKIGSDQIQFISGSKSKIKLIQLHYYVKTNKDEILKLLLN